MSSNIWSVCTEGADAVLISISLSALFLCNEKCSSASPSLASLDISGSPTPAKPSGLGSSKPPLGYFLLGSLKPSSIVKSSFFAAGSPAIDPSITGNCASSPSK